MSCAIGWKPYEPGHGFEANYDKRSSASFLGPLPPIQAPEVYAWGILHCLISMTDRGFACPRY